MVFALQIILNGVATGAVYALVAVGYSLTFTGMRVLNFGLGMWVMLGGMLTYTLYVLWGLNIALAAPIVIVALTGLGVICERLTVRPFLKAGSEAWVMATLAVGLLFIDLAALIWGRDPLRVPGYLGQAVVRFGAFALYPQQILIVACTIALQLSLSNEVTIGPTWLLPALEGALLIGLVIVSPRPNVRHSPIRRRVAIGMIAFVSAANIASLVLLSHRLLHGGKENGHQLILSGIVLWCTNVLLFGLWYWETDRGGPVAREKGERDFPDFLFPQMTSPRWAPKGWMPRLIDYLYVSLTNATAFSPTDTMPLSVAAKCTMGIQSLVSLVTIGLIVSRAVNILAS